jgi:hypothetical protein
MHSTIYNSGMVDVPVGKGGVKEKRISISEYNMFMKGVDRADQYLAYYSLLRKTVNWTKKVALWLTSCEGKVIPVRAVEALRVARG